MFLFQKFKNLKNSTFFDKKNVPAENMPKIGIRKWLKAEKFFGGPSNIYLSRIKNSSLYLLLVPNDSHFTNCTVFFGTPCT